jgi:hypothetical protein
VHSPRLDQHIDLAGVAERPCLDHVKMDLVPPGEKALPPPKDGPDEPAILGPYVEKFGAAPLIR